MMLIVLQIGLFRKTLIDWRIPAGIWVGTGIASLLFTKNLDFGTGNIFLKLVCNVLSIGSLFAWSFMATNYYILDEATTEYIRTDILKTGHLAKGRNGCPNPYAVVSVKGDRKQLIYPCSIDIEPHKFVRLKIQKGVWGFYRVLSQELD